MIQNPASLFQYLLRKSLNSLIDLLGSANGSDLLFSSTPLRYSRGHPIAQKACQVFQTHDTKRSTAIFH